MAVQESCTVDSIFYPVEPVHDEDATIQSDVVCVPIEESELPSPADVPTCEEHTPIAIQHECAVDVSLLRRGVGWCLLPSRMLRSVQTQSVPVESADVPACEEPTFVPSRKELPIAPIPDRSGDLAAL